MPASEILAHPLNAHQHPLDQRAAQTAAFDEVGWVARVVISKRTGRLVDGHMRVELAAERGEAVPYDMVDLSEDEERVVLATMDTITSMATFDPSMMGVVTDGLDMPDALAAALDGFGYDMEDEEEPVEPKTVTLKPLSRAHVLVSVPLDQWDTVSDILDQLDEVPGVEINSTVN